MSQEQFEKEMDAELTKNVMKFKGKKESEITLGDYEDYLSNSDFYGPMESKYKHAI